MKLPAILITLFARLALAVPPVYGEALSCYNYCFAAAIAGVGCHQAIDEAENRCMRRNRDVAGMVFCGCVGYQCPQFHDKYGWKYKCNGTDAGEGGTHSSKDEPDSAKDADDTGKDEADAGEEEADDGKDAADSDEGY